jgi:predicted alpha/beta hydrolase family esterase
MSDFLGDEVVLIGQSLGGIFLAKYFSENTFGKNVKALILVAAPFDEEGMHEPLAEFVLPKSLEKISAQSSAVYLLFSKDDPVVPFSHMGKYKKALANAHEIVFLDKQHFNQPTFPELAEILQKLAR